MVIIGICGEPRSGKTLLMTILLHRDSKHGIQVLTNYHTKFSETINPVDILDFKLRNCSLGLDELHTIIDSRLNSNSNRYFSYFGTQSGKRSVKIYYTAQILGSVDIRMRLITTRIILAQDTPSAFKYTVINQAGKVVRRFSLVKKLAAKFYSLYDTEELITPMELGGSDLDIVSLTHIYEESPTKLAFVMSLKKDYPFINGDLAKSVYDYFQADNVKQVKKLLSIE